jgi:hypothetical protein
LEDEESGPVDIQATTERLQVPAVVFEDSQNSAEDSTDNRDHDDRSLHRAGLKMYRALPPSMLLKFSTALRRFMPVVITYATCFSGTDISDEVFSALRSTWGTMFHLNVAFQQAFQCENDPEKQEYLRAINKGSPILFGNAADLQNPIGNNLKTGKNCIVPWVFLLIAGFVCADKSPQNSKRSSLKGSMQQKTGKTSETFEMIYLYIKLVLPTILVLENVKEIFNDVKDSIDDSVEAALSDGDFVLQRIHELGYKLAMHLVAKTGRCGSRAVRVRIYFIFMRVPQALTNLHSVQYPQLFMY